MDGLCDCRPRYQEQAQKADETEGLPFHRSSSGSRMMEVAHSLIFRAFRSPHPTTVDLIFRSLMYMHAMCQIDALPTCTGMLRTNLLTAGRIRRVHGGTDST
jgi:hypothetical protein